ncbi:MAG: aspartate kinase [Candidatus Micrarchaeota archaeon]|nr:aspartate kinase [Candidatus Micrarchaeota archaeon]
MKFGGSSVANTEMIKGVAGIVKSQVKKKPIVVVSALGGVTNDLIEAATFAANGSGTKKCDEITGRHLAVIKELGLGEQIIGDEVSQLRREMEKIGAGRNLNQKSLDTVMSFGERMSARIVAACLVSVGVNSKAYDAFNIGLVTDSSFGNANPLPKASSMIRRSLSGVSGVPVVTGFIGKDRVGNITTLGRGGSDYTASLIGMAVRAKEIQIWTNTNGVLTADPRIVSGALNIRDLSYEEELELEYLGANTLHPKGIRPAFEKNITVRVLNTLHPKESDTVIKSRINEKMRVASITHKDGMHIILLRAQDPPKRLHDVFDIIRRHGISIDSVLTSRTDIMIIFSGYYNGNIKDALKELGSVGKVSIRSGRAKISVVGKALFSIPGISGKIFSSLADMPIEAISYGSSGMSQSFFVKEQHAGTAIRKLHRTFFGA